MSIGSAINNSPTTVWNAKTILEKGSEFLHTEKKIVTIYSDLWAQFCKETQCDNHYSSIELFKSIELAFEDSIKRIGRLEKAALYIVSAENPIVLGSETKSKLLNIIKISAYTKEYLKDTIENFRPPTFFWRSFRKLSSSLNHWLPKMTLLTGCAFLGEKMTGYKLPSYYAVPWKVSVIAFFAISFLLREDNSLVRKKSPKWTEYSNAAIKEEFEKFNKELSNERN